LKPREVHHLQAHAPTDEEITSWIGAPVTDEFGKSVGKVEDVYLVDGRLEWLLIKHRRSHHFLAPVKDAVGDHQKLFLPYTAEHIESAPETEPGEPAGEDTLAAAQAHYGLKR
jgi:sporulation protein YlmC with PRC-barrel domain